MNKMSIDKDELLNKLKELLEDEVSKISFETWIKPLGIRAIEKDNIVFTTVSEYQKDFIENKFNSLIFNTLRYITNKDWTFSVIDLSKETEENNNIIADKKSNVPEAELESNHSTLNPKYTFETFVVGNNNRFAHAAALAVGNEPGKSYNPLFLYGGVGLGKTHLMHAIGNRIVEDNTASNVLYVTSEKFTNQLINAIKDNAIILIKKRIFIVLIRLCGNNLRSLQHKTRMIRCKTLLNHFLHIIWRIRIPIKQRYPRRNTTTQYNTTNTQQNQQHKPNKQRHTQTHLSPSTNFRMNMLA